MLLAQPLPRLPLLSSGARGHGRCCTPMLLPVGPAEHKQAGPHVKSKPHKKVGQADQAGRSYQSTAGVSFQLRCQGAGQMLSTHAAVGGTCGQTQAGLHVKGAGAGYT